MITERNTRNMGRAFVYIVIATVLLLFMGIVTTNIAGAKKVYSCTGTYLVDIGEGETRTEGIWTISQDGTFQGTDSAEQVFGFSQQQGAWVSNGSYQAKATWLDFSFDPNLPTPGGYVRVDAEFIFGSDCESMTGTLDVWFYLDTEDPLDRTTGGTSSSDISFTGRRVNP